MGTPDKADRVKRVGDWRIHLHHCLGSSRLVVAALFLAVGVVTFSAISTAAYWAGRGVPTDLRFLESNRAPTRDEAFVACPVEYALHSSEANDVIFLGDSVCLHGLDPYTFEKLTSLKAFNLGSFGFVGPVGYPIVARAYFLNHPKPRAVVLCVSALSFDVDPEKHGGSIPRRFENAYGPELGAASQFAKLVRIGSQSGRNWLCRWQDVRDVPLYAMQDETYRSYQRRWAASRGYVVLPGTHGKLHQLEEFAKVAQIRDDWNLGIGRLADECKSFAVPLIIRFAPLSTELRQGRDYAPVERWAESVKALRPEIIMAQPALQWYDVALSWDRVHLNVAGVEKFMPVVARDVKAALSK
jgi:hypothetical protein